MTTVTLTIPDELYEQAQAAGILTDELLVRFIEQALEREQKIQALTETMKKLHALQPPVTPEEIDAEIAAYRAEEYAKEAALKMQNQSLPENK